MLLYCYYNDNRLLSVNELKPSSKEQSAAIQSITYEKRHEGILSQNGSSLDEVMEKFPVFAKYPEEVFN